ncbi:MAG: biopolymer transporter ExbD [Planctomycetota bacterium]
MSKTDDQDFEFEAPLVRKKKNRGDDVEMDITPMIDITFLLLIFFIVCSTPDQKSSFELAEARHGKGVSERNSIFITISAESADPAPVYLADGVGGETLTSDPDEQKEIIREAVEKGRSESKENVLIKADRNVAHRDVARVIKAVSQVEGAKIHLAVLESD